MYFSTPCHLCTADNDSRSGKTFGEKHSENGSPSYWEHPPLASYLMLTMGAGLQKDSENQVQQISDKTSQELRMLSSVTINCQVTMIVMNSGSQFVRISTSVSNVTSLQDCLFNCQNCQKWSKILSVVKIFKNYLEL